MDFKGLPNGASFISIDHCVGELLPINKVSSDCEHITVTRFNVEEFNLCRNDL